MAQGDVRWFSQALVDLGNAVHNLSSVSIKLGIITSVATPAIATAAPHWAGTGTTNFATNQVTPGTSYTTGGPALASVTWQLQTGVPTFRAANVTVAQDATGFTNARWGIFYNDTDANKRALAFVDLGSDRSIVGGALVFDWFDVNGDILTITQPA